MKEYEGLIIIEPSKEATLKEIVSSITSSITTKNGKIHKEENWGKRKLAYPIRKSREGIYYKLEFSIDPSKITELNNTYKLNPDILRTMITVK